jgi:hypothetical protein
VSYSLHPEAEAELAAAAAFYKQQAGLALASANTRALLVTERVHLLASSRHVFKRPDLNNPMRNRAWRLRNQCNRLLQIFCLNHGKSGNW